MLVMTHDDVLYDDIKRMDEEMEKLIGRKVFGYISCPTETSMRITFADAAVFTTMNAAHGYMRHLLIAAERNPGDLPWPLCEPV